MKSQASLDNISRTLDGKTILTLITSAPPDEVAALKGEALDLELKKHREKRSLDANAYAWKLIEEIARALESSKDEVYEELLQKYGKFLLNEDGIPVTLTVSKSVDMNRVEGHYKLYKESPDGRFKAYFIIRGSSDYNTKEMSDFIKGVVSDAQELNIETLTPHELELLKGAAGQWKHGNH